MNTRPWALLAATVAWGVTLSTRLLGRHAPPAWLLDLHRHLGALAVVFVGVHVGALVADSYTHFRLADLFVPLASTWKPGPVAWGVVGLYLLLAVELTSLVRRRLPAKVWRRTHLLSFPLFVLATVHLAQAGTDRANTGVIAGVLAAAAVITFVTSARVLSPRRRRVVAAPGKIAAECAGSSTERERSGVSSAAA